MRRCTSITTWILLAVIGSLGLACGSQGTSVTCNCQRESYDYLIYRRVLQDVRDKVYDLISSNDDSRKMATNVTEQLQVISQQLSEFTVRQINDSSNLLAILRGLLQEAMQRLEISFANVSCYKSIQTSEQRNTSFLERIRAVYDGSLNGAGFQQSIDRMQEINSFMSPTTMILKEDNVYTGCQDASRRGRSKAGLYNIEHFGQPKFLVWCEFDGTRGWVVIQRRFDGSVDFFRSWWDYQNGFGSLYGEHWQGLRNIALLSEHGVKLSIYMETFEGRTMWANYSSFRVAGAGDFYRLSVSGYAGTDMDSLAYHSGSRFSTWDQDNDNSSDNCAAMSYGGWWYARCHYSNLNGRYEKTGETNWTSNNWFTPSYRHRPLKRSVMLINA